MTNIIFPTDTATATPVAADLIMIADVSDSNRPKDNTIENVVLAIVDDTSTITTRLWSANKINTVFATKTDGAASSTDNAVARFDSTTGKIIQNSVVLIGDSGDITWVNSITIGWASGNTLVVDTNTFITDATNHRNWILTTAPTHSLTLGNASTGIAFHDAADQTSTLMERWKISWNAGLFEIRTDIGSAVASVQNMQLVVSNSTWGTKTDLTLRKSTTPFFDVWSSSSSTTGDRARFFSSSHAMTSSSGEQRALAITHWVTQTWWANYISLFINITENSVGSWSNALIKAQVWWITKMSVDNNWWLLNARVVVASWTTTPVTITAAESNKVYTNEWATAKITYNLPTAVAWLTYSFIVQDADWMDVTAAAWDTIRRNTNVTATWGTVTSTTIWSLLTLVSINATEWLATSEIWTWA